MTTLYDTGRNHDMLTVTPAARVKLTEIIEAQVTDDGHVRVSVVRGPHGCVHGWRLGIEHQPQPDDVVYTVGQLQVIVGSELTEALKGATIDYREDGDVIGFSINAPKSQDHGSHSGCSH